MIIDNEDYGDFNVYLADDGSLDTVIDVHNNQCGSKDIRFSQEYGANYRDEDGTMTDVGFVELAQEAIEVYIELYIL